MSRDTAALLAKLEAQPTTPILCSLRSLLETPSARVLANPSEPTTVSRIMPTWRARLKNSQALNAPVKGLVELLDRLKELPEEHLVYQNSIIGETEAGNVFFDAETHDLLGAVFVVLSHHSQMFFFGRGTSSPISPVPRKGRMLQAATFSTSANKKRMA